MEGSYRSPTKTTLRKQSSPTRNGLKSLSVEEHTFHGLVLWKEQLFHKAALVIVSAKLGKKDKLLRYIASLTELKHALRHKMTTMVDEDKSNDLRIMLQKVNILLEHVQLHYDEENNVSSRLGNHYYGA